MPNSPEEFTPADLAAIEATTQEVGRYLFEHLDRRRPSVLERRWWDDRIMQWAMQDESVKVQMFRFIDVLPMLHTREAVTGHLQEYFHDVKQRLPSAVRLGLAVATPHSIAGRALAIAARKNAQSHARRFIAGTNADEVMAAALRARKEKMGFTLDLLGEAVISDVEADRYCQAFCDLIRDIAPTVNAWPEIPQVDRGVMDALPRVNVSIKLSAMDGLFDAADQDGTRRRVGQRLRKLLRLAREHQAFVNVDMESYETKDLTLRIFKDILLEDEFRDIGDVGVVIQCYLQDSLGDLAALRDWAQQRGKPVWVRLVKGAYWDYETVHAHYKNWPIPVFQQKWRSDANFEKLTRFLMRNHAHLRPALGSHNLRSLAHGIAVARHIGLPQTGFELQMLYGMADDEKRLFVDMGHRMRVYMPFGELIPGMAYLVRRLLENTSNDSFLKASFTDQASPETLLMNPLDHEHDTPRPAAKSESQRPAQAASPLEQFTNEPPADFSREENRQSMRRALEQVGGQLGHNYPLVIGGQHVTTDAKLESINPSHKSQTVGTTASATAEQARRPWRQPRGPFRPGPRWKSGGGRIFCAAPPRP